jgi:tRNA methyl transferase
LEGRDLNLKQEIIIVIDFGGQYNQLVARRVRENNVYCEIYSYKTDIEVIKAKNPKGIILTGGPNSCYEKDAPSYTKELFELGIPVLGLCYGAQLMMHILGGKVERAKVREYGKTEVIIDKKDSLLLENVNSPTICWMSHFDYISKTAPNFEVSAHSKDCPAAIVECEEKKLYGIQFHPEVLHTAEGDKIFANFVKNICKCLCNWKMDTFVENAIEQIRKTVGNKKALCALSGGVDSSVAAVLLSKAIGENLTCVFVDHGLLRKNEGDEVEAVFGKDGAYKLNFIRVNARQRFYDKLKGVEEPEKKRKIIGEEFIRVFEEEAKKIGKVDFLVQGTIYPDVVESGLGGESIVIKSHHNVGGLPEHVEFNEIIEPLRDLFKDEVRKAGLELGIPEKLVFRQPFPGPGLGIRIIGEVTEEKVKIVQDADAIYREEISNAGLDRSIGQYFAALTNMRSVGVMGDERTYDYAVVLRAVNTIDFMTAEAASIPYEVLQKVTSRIINEVGHVNRVLYDITSKPPGTIELE